MGKIKVGGKVYDPQKREENSREFISHAAFIAFDEASRLVALREYAIFLWNDLGRLEENWETYQDWTLRSEIQGAIVQTCADFLAAERRATIAWEELTEDQREAEGLCDWFRMSPHRAHLYGLWRHPILVRGGELPPKEFPMDRVALLSASPEQLKVYDVWRYNGG